MTTFLAPALPMILVDELAALENKLEEIDISVPDIQVPDVELPPCEILGFVERIPGSCGAETKPAESPTPEVAPLAATVTPVPAVT